MTAAIPLRMQDLATSSSPNAQKDYPNDGENTNVIRLTRTFTEPSTSVGYQQNLHADGTSANSINESCDLAKLNSVEAIFEIRRLSGLTWELLSELFNVSRRTVIQWANGRLPTEHFESEIRRVLETMRHLNEGDQLATLERLLTVVDGSTLFDNLVEHRYAEVLQLPAGTAAVANSRQHSVAFLGSESEQRQLAPPALLLGAIQERPELPVGKTRIFRPERKKKIQTE